MTGETILHYKILEKLGEGGMGEVYKAQDTKLDRFVALKFLPSKLTATEAEKARFIQEAKSASAMNHPNVCTIYSIEEYENDNGDKQLFIAMEFVDGRTLSDKKETLSDKQKLEISAQVAEGLAAAHDKGIVHRDIKPDNIMIRKDGIVQIMDFGLAKLYSSKDISRLTKAGTTLGTMGYMSPEQIQGQDVDHRTDIFSLGVVLYELFAGVSPFKGMHEAALVYEIVNTDVPPIFEIKPEIDPELDRLILECLEKDPMDRCQSAAELARNLRRLKRVSTGSRTASRIQQAVPIANERKKEIKKWKLISFSLAVLCIAAISAFVISNSSSKPGINLSHYKYTPFETEGYVRDGSWSPDGKSIAYTKYVDGNWELRVRSLDNPRSALLTTTESQFGFLNLFWSSDGNNLYFWENGKLHSIGLAGGNSKVVIPYFIGAAAISSDNKTLAFWTTEKVDSTYRNGKASLFISLPDGSKSRLNKPNPFSTSQLLFPDIIKFSPDGSKIALLITSSKSENIWILPWPDNANAKPKKIFQFRTPKGIANIEWLPDSKNILFSYNSRIWVGNINDETFRQITASVQNESLVSVSPDGKQILVNENNTNYDIVMLPFDGSPLKKVMASSVDEFSPSLSNDGRLMSYVTNRTGKNEIWMENESGDEYPVVKNSDFPDNTGTLYFADISPDGKHIACYRSTDKSIREVWISNSAGGKPVPVYTDSTGFFRNFCWSPDGQSFYTELISRNNHINKITPLGNGPVIQLPDSAWSDCHPVWSPNGKWIALGQGNSSQYPKGRILLMSPDGKQFRTIIPPVIPSEWLYCLAWSRDSKFLYIASSVEKVSRLDVIDIETGKSRKLAEYGTDVKFGFFYSQMSAASISRDGKGLLVSAQFLNGSLYILDGALNDVK